MQARALLVYLSVCISAGEISGSVHYFCSQPNEVFLECGCHRNCRNPTRTCDGVCEKGCFCRGDELRDDDGDCVAAKYCPELQMDEFLTLEPVLPYRRRLISHQQSNTSKPSSDEISDISDPQNKGDTESCTKKIYTLEPFGKFGLVSQTKKLYTYNPLYGEDSIFHNRESYTLDPNKRVIPVSNAKNVYTSKQLHNERDSVPKNEESQTSKPRGKWKVISYHKVLYSSKSRGEQGEESAATQNKELHTSMVRAKADPVSQNKELYGQKSLPNSALSLNKDAYATISRVKWDSVFQDLYPTKASEKDDPAFPDFLYKSKTKNNIGPVTPKKEFDKSKSLGKVGLLSQNKELYTSKFRGKAGSVFPILKLFNMKSLGQGSPLFQNKELYTSISRGKGASLSPKELFTFISRGKVGLVFPSKELLKSKSQSKLDPVYNKELHASKSSDISNAITYYKKLNMSKSLSNGSTASPDKELHASKSRDIGIVVPYYKELNTMKSLGNGSAVTAKKLHSLKSKDNEIVVPYFKKSNATKSRSKGLPAHNIKVPHKKLQCPPNEEFRGCEHCNRTCEDPKPVCLAECSRGCFCKKNLLRDVDGSCVQLKRCSNIWKRMKRMNKIRKRFNAHF